MHEINVKDYVLKPVKGYNVFSDIYLNSVKFHTKNAMLSVTFSKSFSYETNFGVTISKKKAAKAVIRNRVKRLLRESIIKIIRDTDIFQYGFFFEIFIIVWKEKVYNPKDIDLKTVFPEIRELFNKANKYYNEINK